MHTPGPWTTGNRRTLADGTTLFNSPDEIIVEEGDTRRLIAQCHGGHERERYANARIIVTAVNNHERLVEALRNLIDTFEQMHPGSEHPQARAALAALDNDPNDTQRR